MLLVIDMGNTNITVGVFDGKKRLFQSRMATDRKMLEDTYAVALLQVLQLYGIPPTAVTGAILSSVVPPLDHVLQNAVHKITGVQPLLVTKAMKSGLRLAVDHPSTLGADLIVGAVAAVARVGAPCIVWDLGTATTVSVVDRDRAYRGCAIMPGVVTGITSLTERTSLLPSISLEAPETVVGTNTAACLRSGVVYGTAAMMDGMTQRIEEEMGETMPVVVTGGLGREISEQCKKDITYVDDLLLEGLRILYEMNRES